MSATEYYLVTIGVFGCINAIMALGFNMQFGQAGIINIAYIVLVAVGAYGTAIASVGPSPGNYVGGWGWAFPWNMLFGVACALVFAIILGAIALSRLRHDYLALTLFALGQGLLVLATNDTVFLGGVAGVNGVPTPFSDSLTPADAQLAFLGLGAVCLALVFLMFWRVSASPLGRALKAVRDDEEAAVALGKRVWRLKMVAFLLGGGAAGLAGSLLVIYVGGWNPGGWQATETFILLAAVIVGGRGRNVGALVGSVIVFEGIVQSVQFLPIIGPPELLPSLQPIAVGALLLAFLWWRPQGVLPEQKERFSGTTGRDSTINGLGLLAVSPPRQRDDV